MPGQEPKYWLHRISWEWQVSYPLYKEGYLSIGWSDFGTEELLSKLRNNFEGTINEEWGELSRSRFYLLNFISKMKKGDYVVVPRNGTFDLVKIIGENVLTAETLCSTKSDLLESLSIEKQEAQNKLKVDLGFFWEIEIISARNSRGNFDTIARKLRYQGTNLRISGVESEIKQIIEINNPQISFAEENDECSFLDNLTKEKCIDFLKIFFEKVGANLICANKPNNLLEADVLAMVDKRRETLLVFICSGSADDEKWVSNKINEFEELSKSSKEKLKLWLVSMNENDSEEKEETSNIWKIYKNEFKQMFLDIDFNKSDNKLLDRWRNA